MEVLMESTEELFIGVFLEISWVFGLPKSAAENLGRRRCDPFTRMLNKMQEEVRGRSSQCFLSK